MICCHSRPFQYRSGAVYIDRDRCEDDNYRLKTGRERVNAGRDRQKAAPDRPNIDHERLPTGRERPKTDNYRLKDGQERVNIDRDRCEDDNYRLKPVGSDSALVGAGFIQ